MSQGVNRIHFSGNVKAKHRGNRARSTLGPGYIKHRILYLLVENNSLSNSNWI